MENCRLCDRSRERINELIEINTKLNLRVSELKIYNKVISDKLAELQKEHAELKLKYEACERDYEGSFRPLSQIENLFKETFVNGKHWGLLFTSEIFTYAKYNTIIDAAIAQALARKLTCKLSEIHTKKLQNPEYKNGEYKIVVLIDEEKVEAPWQIAIKEEMTKIDKRVEELYAMDEKLKCKHCSLPLSEHDGSGFCPAGTEEFGGRR